MSLVYISAAEVVSEVGTLMNNVNSVLPPVLVPMVYTGLGEPFILFGPVERPVFEIDESELPY
jgi:hypothetical protein